MKNVANVVQNLITEVKGLIKIFILLCFTCQGQQDSIRRPITLNLQLVQEYEDTKQCGFVLSGVGFLFTGYGVYSKQFIPITFGSIICGSGIFIFTYNHNKFKKYLQWIKKN